MLFPLCLIPCLLVVSCATEKEDNVVPIKAQTMEQRFGGGKTIKQDASGNWSADVKATSLPENNRQSAYFTGDSNLPKTYKAGEYAKNSWWGGKSYPREPYGGNTDGSRFQTAARAQGKGAREAKVAADSPGPYQAGAYQTGSAREASGKRFGKPVDAQTANRREDFPEPDVAGWKEQRRMNIQETKSILGRD